MANNYTNLYSKQKIFGKFDIQCVEIGNVIAADDNFKMTVN